MQASLHASCDRTQVTKWISLQGRFLFAVESEFDGPIPHPAGIEVAADVEDRAETKIYLTGLFNEALPSRR